MDFNTKILFLVFLLTPLFSCSSKEKQNNSGSELSAIEFNSTNYEFGDIAYASDGRCSFTFKNTSDVPLVINTVRASCGCTSPEWPDNPIEPGKTGSIGITYNTHIPGNFYKSITVYSNSSNSPVKLFIKGNVLPQPDTLKTH